jgi:hypothetical protein
MARLHEAATAALFGARLSRGSGNQWKTPIDWRQNHMGQRFAIAGECKSTLGGSISVTRAMWEKAAEQAGDEEPSLHLRFYDTECLEDVYADLSVVSTSFLARLMEEANRA